MKYITYIMLLFLFYPVLQINASSAFTMERTRSVTSDILLVNKINEHSYLELIESSDPDDKRLLVEYSKLYTFFVDRIIDTDGKGSLSHGDEFDIVIKSVIVEKKKLQEMVIDDDRIKNKDVVYTAMNPSLEKDIYIIFINQEESVKSEYGRTPVLYSFFYVDDSDNVLIKYRANNESHFSREFRKISSGSKISMDIFETLMSSSPVLMNDKDSYRRSLDIGSHAIIRVDR